MDNQLALMKKLQKDPDTIAYAHNEEIVLIKRVVDDDDGTRLFEVTLNPENGSKTAERIIHESEMKLIDFDTMKEFLTGETRQEFNADWSVTKLNVDFDVLEKTDLFSVQSVEDDYIERQNVADDFRTLDNAMKVLDSCLTKIQKKRYILSRAKGLSTREIAEKEGVSQRTVQDSLELAERKIKIFQENPEKYLSNPSKKLYK